MFSPLDGRCAAGELDIVSQHSRFACVSAKRLFYPFRLGLHVAGGVHLTSSPWSACTAGPPQSLPSPTQPSPLLQRTFGLQEVERDVKPIHELCNDGYLLLHTLFFSRETIFGEPAV